MSFADESSIELEQQKLLIKLFQNKPIVWIIINKTLNNFEEANLLIYNLNELCRGEV